MQFSILSILALASSAFAYWNCELPFGGTFGLCVGNGGDVGSFPCDSVHSCKVKGNGCIPLGNAVANCS
ncbi:hypothetical protein HII31_07138 [Pseudocercospora fuligena]|uniref:Uncharacterized protein n=1 Tax=Pseudocercospora fuligena TaxID=685502 RepID=A0A8H6RIE3_9PEZI|nr:hypothetical protein HII31_07138 [Pseudocercospora fuligena]